MAVKKSDKEVRSGLVKLKNLGLYKGDIRKVNKTSLEDKKQRSGFLRVLRKFAEEIGLVDEAAKTNSKVAKVNNSPALVALASRGYPVAKNSGLVSIPRKKGEKVTVGRTTGNITYTREVKDRKSGKVKTEIIFEPNVNFSEISTVEQAVKEYANLYTQKAGDKIAFTYYGFISKETFASVEEAMLKIISYGQTQNDIGKSLDPADIPELMKSIQIITYIGNDSEYGRNKNLVKEKKANFNTYFKKLSKKRG